MLRIYSAILLVSLSLALPSEAGCVRETFIALTQKLSGGSRPDEAFKKYYEEEDPQGWKKFIDETVSKTGGVVGLGGNAGNTYSISFPDGSSLVTKDFPSAQLAEHLKILRQLERWSSEGVGPDILGVSLLPGSRLSEKRFLVVMEDLLAVRNKLGKKILGGNGNDVHLLRKEPEAAKNWVLDRMLYLLDRHPDPHPMNVVFRVTRRESSSEMPKEGTYYQEGDRFYQVFLIDPSGVEGDPEHSLFNGDLEKTPPALLQYHRGWKQNFFKREMGLR